MPSSDQLITAAPYVVLIAVIYFLARGSFLVWRRLSRPNHLR